MAPKWCQAPFCGALLVLAMVLSSCGGAIGGALGFGDVLDFDPPTLYLDKGVPNPYYLTLNPGLVPLTGTCTDNVGVAKVVCLDADDDRVEYGQAVLSGNTWTFAAENFNFTTSDNGRKFAVKIVAFDRAGNSAEQSTAYVNIIVDYRPPVFKNPAVYRSPRRIMTLLPLQRFYELEDRPGRPGLDPYANRPQFVEYYQNGAFWIRVEINEEETALDNSSIIMELYDVDHDGEGQHIYSRSMDLDSIPYSPQWTITETELAAAGDLKGWAYTTRLEDGGRIYLRVRFIAKDRAGNQADRVADFGVFCLFRKPDVPKGILGGGIGERISASMAIPVDVFDDDALEVVYTDLLTLEQFNKYNDDITSGMSPEEKDQAALNQIKEILVDNRPDLDGVVSGIVKNWKGLAIEDLIMSPAILPESITVLLETDTSTLGDYRVIVITKDKKDLPHVEGVAETRGEPIWGYNVYPIVISDENAPLIVVDTVDITRPIGTGRDQYDPSSHLGRENVPDAPGYTAPSSGRLGASTGNSPEENTFPDLEEGKYFLINGYTLDINSGGTGEVEVFRMAWIPYGISYNGKGQDSDEVLEAVKDALRYDDGTETGAAGHLYPPGVQHWELPKIDEVPGYNLSLGPDSTQKSYFITGSTQTIPAITGEPYTKQTFKKLFNVLGDEPDDLKPTYTNFKFDGDIENEAKLFVLYAKDVDSNHSYRTIRLLGQKDPPKLNVYDFTLREELRPPAPNAIDPVTDTGLAAYSKFYDGIIAPPSGIPLYTDSDLAAPFQAYSPGNVLKFWAEASGEGGKGIEIKSIKMEDITTETPETVGYVNSTRHDLTYVMDLPDRDVKTFLFTAENSLGVKAMIQRTIAVTSTSMLIDILSPLPNGTYGYTPPTPAPVYWDPDKIITLQAHFSAPVRVKAAGNGNVPMMNIRYKNGSGVWTYEAVKFAGTITGGYSEPTMYLEFKWPVPENATGRLETLDLFNYNDGGTNDLPLPNDRPINLNGATILDADTLEPAFIPGGEPAAGYNNSNWTNSSLSLQGLTPLGGPLDSSFPGKQIMLDGKLPTVVSFTAGGKLPYGTTTEYYFKSGETISFILRASKDIIASDPGNPRVEFEIWYPYVPGSADALANPLVSNVKKPNPADPTNGYYFAEWTRPDGDNGMLFNKDADELPDGAIKIMGINTDQGKIEDWVGNSLNITGLLTDFNASKIVVDNTAPPPVVPRLDGVVPNPPSALNVYNKSPVLTIDGIANTTVEPWGTFTEYSLDGVKWVSFPELEDRWTTHYNSDTHADDDKLRIMSGGWVLVVRQRDKAGNISDDSDVYDLMIKSDFPKILAIGTVQPTGMFKVGSTIDFTLDFEEPVYTTNENSYIIVADRYYRDATELADLLTLATSAGPGSPQEEFYNLCLNFSKAKNISGQIHAVAKRYSAIDKNTTLTFKWAGITGKQMPNGVTIREIHLEGDVVDAYGNGGVKSFEAVPYGTNSSHDPEYPEYNGMVIMYKDSNDMPTTINFGIPLMDPAKPAEWNPASKIYVVSNINGAGHQVFTIPPTLVDAVPKLVGLTLANGTVVNETNFATGIVLEDDDRKIITLTFDDYVKQSAGYIRIRPHGNYPIPPVFPKDGYVVGDNPEDDPADLDIGVYVDGFYDIYNSTNIDNEAGKNGPAGNFTGLTAADLRGYLQITKNIWEDDTTFVLYDATATGRTQRTDYKGLDLRTGLDYGPYRNTTQGLIQGPGFEASLSKATAYNAIADTIPSDTSTYNGKAVTTAAANTNWNQSGSDYMVPDTRSKYVLDFKYPIMENGAIFFPSGANTGNYTTRINTDITNIRKTLNAAHFRWKEIDVISSAVQVSEGSAEKPAHYGLKVTITLDRPLPAGMKWDITIDEGAFEDEAGNKINEVSAGTFWFWSGGVQKPVIRVDRRSMDYRTVSNLTSYFSKGSGGSPTFPYSPQPFVNGESGTRAYNTHIDSFNFIGFRVETETPGVTDFKYSTLKGQSQTSGDTGYEFGAIHMTGWGNTTDLAYSGLGSANWNALGSATMGEWVRPNLIRRVITGKGHTGSGLKYRVTENGTDTTNTGTGNMQILRSYNKDATKTQLDTQYSSSSANVNAGTSYYLNIRAHTTIADQYLQSLKASKNYVIAQAVAPHSGTKPKTAKGYEGIFKTIVVMYHGNGTNGEFAPSANGMAPTVILGSNSLAPNSTIPGFPLMLQNVDCRYLKYMYNGSGPGAGNNMSWMTTEIVSSWLVSGASADNNSGLLANPRMLHGDAGSYVSAGYGDLIYTIHQDE